MQHTGSTQRLRPVIDLAVYRPVRDVVLHALPVPEALSLGRGRSEQILPSLRSWPYPRALVLGEDEQMALVDDDHELKDALRQAPLAHLVELLADRVAALIEEKMTLPAPSRNTRGRQHSINVHDGTPVTTERVLINATEAAAMLGISVNAVRLRTQRGQMPAGSVVRTGRRLQFRVEALRSLRPYTKRSP